MALIGINEWHSIDKCSQKKKKNVIIQLQSRWWSYTNIRDLVYKNISKLKFMLNGLNFRTWLLIGWQYSRH